MQPTTSQASLWIRRPSQLQQTHFMLRTTLVGVGSRQPQAPARSLCVSLLLPVSRTHTLLLRLCLQNIGITPPRLHRPPSRTPRHTAQTCLRSTSTIAPQLLPKSSPSDRILRCPPQLVQAEPSPKRCVLISHLPSMPVSITRRKSATCHYLITMMQRPVQAWFNTARTYVQGQPETGPDTKIPALDPNSFDPGAMRIAL